MKRALIDDLGRIAQVEPMGGDFHVSPPFMWVDCPDECEAYSWLYDAETGVCAPPPGPPLAELKAAALARINAARDAEEAGGFGYLGKTFDSDPLSVQRLFGAAMAAQGALATGAVQPNDFMVTWTTADGSTLDMTYAQVAQLPAVMVQAANALHVKARGLKAQIDAAVDADGVMQVVW